MPLNDSKKLHLLNPRTQTDFSRTSFGIMTDNEISAAAEILNKLQAFLYKYVSFVLVLWKV